MGRVVVGDANLKHLVALGVEDNVEIDVLTLAPLVDFICENLVKTEEVLVPAAMNSKPEPARAGLTVDVHRKLVE